MKLVCYNIMFSGGSCGEWIVHALYNRARISANYCHVKMWAQYCKISRFFRKNWTFLKKQNQKRITLMSIFKCWLLIQFKKWNPNKIYLWAASL